ncbi:MAG: 1-deoxy-D-xylulose-5-phosphate reductoisomerase, partial [Yoonia sp.]
MRKISIFGATGSVGQSALDLVARDAQSYDVVALTGGRNVVQLAHDARRLHADLAVTCYPEYYNELKDLLAETDV